MLFSVAPSLVYVSNSPLLSNLGRFVLSFPANSYEAAPRLLTVVMTPAELAPQQEVILVDTGNRGNGGDEDVTKRATDGGSAVTVEVGLNKNGFVVVDPCAAWLSTADPDTVCSFVDVAIGDVNRDGHTDIVTLMAVPIQGQRLAVALGPFAGVVDDVVAPILMVEFEGTFESIVDQARHIAVIGGANPVDAGSIFFSAPTYPPHGVVGVIRHPLLGHSGPTSSFRLLFNNVTKVTFGESITVCDVDGDGNDELVVGAPDRIEDTNAPHSFVAVYQAQPTGFDVLKNITSTSTSAEFDFGYRVACADLDDDKRAEVIIGYRPTIDKGGLVARTWSSWSDPLLSMWSTSWDDADAASVNVAAAKSLILLGLPNSAGGVGLSTQFFGWPEPRPYFRSTELLHCNLGRAVSASTSALLVAGHECENDSVGVVYAYLAAEHITSSTIAGTNSAGTSTVSSTASQASSTTTSLQPAPSTTSAAGTIALTAGTGEAPAGNTFNVRVIAGLGAGLVVLVSIGLLILLWRRFGHRRRQKAASLPRMPTSGASASFPHGRVTRGASATRVRTRRSRAPTSSTQPHAPVSAYGETSLAVPGEYSSPAYQQTSLYPAPTVLYQPTIGTAQE